MNMGEKIAFLRKHNGLTQEELAQLLKVSNQAVSKWESEKCYPDIELIPEIAEIFSCSIDMLFSKEPLTAETLASPPQPAEHAAQLPPEQLERFQTLEALARQYQKGTIGYMEFRAYRLALLQDICRVSEDKYEEYTLEKSECFLLMEELARQHEKGHIGQEEFRAFKGVLLNVICDIHPEENDDADHEDFAEAP